LSAPGPVHSGRRRIGIGVAGIGWMGHVHTRSHDRVLHHYPELPIEPVLIAVADPEPGRASAAAQQYRFRRSTQDWRDLLDDPEVRQLPAAFRRRRPRCARGQQGQRG
jgi:predicted dehydrogenase